MKNENSNTMNYPIGQIIILEEKRYNDMHKIKENYSLNLKLLGSYNMGIRRKYNTNQ